MNRENAGEFLLQSRLTELDGLAEQLGAFCLLQGMDEEARADVRLVVEEAVSNTIRHGYTDPRGHEIRVRAAVENGELSLDTGGFRPKLAAKDIKYVDYPYEG